jgi:hypothetical protein
LPCALATPVNRRRTCRKCAAIAALRRVLRRQHTTQTLQQGVPKIAERRRADAPGAHRTTPLAKWCDSRGDRCKFKPARG